MSYFADQAGSRPARAKPRWWLRTSGRTGEFGGPKWAPYTPEMAKRLGEVVLALFLLAAVDGRGQFPFAEGDRLLFTMAPFPYMSGGVAHALLEEFPFTFLPPLEKAEQMTYERADPGGPLAGARETASIISMPSRWCWCGSQNSSRADRALCARHSSCFSPPAMLRIDTGPVQGAHGRQEELLPQDLWTVKGIATGGTDTELFKDQIRAAWGRDTVEAYGCTEAGLFALQPWANQGLVFLPYAGFSGIHPDGGVRQQRGRPELISRALCSWTRWSSDASTRW